MTQFTTTPPFIINNGLRLTVLLLCLSTNAGASSNQIELIENNITPKIVIKGEPAKPQSIIQRMAHYKVPGVSIAVARDGKLAWAKGYGIANINLATRVTTETLFQAGSISKPVAALGALILVDQKKIKLDHNINHYLKSWKVTDNSLTRYQPVTLRHLLNHTAGATVHGFPGYPQGEKLPTNIQILEGQGNTPAVDIDFKPGSQWRYSGGGYTIMEQMVEDTSSLGFAKFLAESVLQPLAMTNSSYQQPLPKNLWNQASAAYDSQGNQLKGNWNNYPEQAAAGLWTTPSDLLKYLLAIQKIVAGDNKGIIKRQLVLEMLSPDDNQWGLGPSIDKVGQETIFGHGGKNAGFTNEFTAFVNKGDSVVIMANGDNANPLITELKMAISNYYNWGLEEPVLIENIKLNKTVALTLPGKYEFADEPGYFVELNIKDNKVMIFDPSTEVLSIFAATSDNTLINLESGSKIVLKKDENGKVKGFIWSEHFQFNKVG